VPFRKGLKRNQDTDWVLQALRLPEVSLALVPEPLTIFYNERKRKRVTSGSEWQMCRDWAVENRALFTPAALSTCLAILPMNMAAQEGADWGAMRSLLADCRKFGKLNLKTIWLFTLYGVLYPYLRKIMAPGMRKKAVYYGSRVNSLWRFSRSSR
jgi:hypothetical protein